MTISLGPFRLEDCETLFRWANDPEMVRWTRPYRPISWYEHEAWFRGLNQRPETRTVGIMRTDKSSVVSDQSSVLTLIGMAQLMHIDPVHRHAEVSIKLAQEARGQGAGSKALVLLIELACQHLNLQRLYTHVWAKNERAIRAYEKAGFAREGLLRRHVYIAGERLDVVVMGWP